MKATTLSTTPYRPESKFMTAVDVLKRFMKKYQYGIFDGAIYKKAPGAAFTYVHCSSVHDFLHHILGNMEIAEHIAQHVNQLTNMLSPKSSRLIEPLVMDYNFIEVLPKYHCFDISKKKFVKNPRDLSGIFIFFSL